MDDEHSTRSPASAKTVVVVTFSDDATEVWSSKTALPESARRPVVIFQFAAGRGEVGIVAATEAQASSAPPDGELDA